MANTCKTVETQLNKVVGAVIVSPSNSYAVRRSKDDRPYIETFFRTLAGKGFQRLSNTTGAKPADKGGLNSDRIALESAFQFEYAQELPDSIIANYNASPHTSLGHRSPLAFLDFMTSGTRCLLRHAVPDAVANLLSYRKIVTVQGVLRLGENRTLI